MQPQHGPLTGAENHTISTPPTATNTLPPPVAPSLPQFGGPTIPDTPPPTTVPELPLASTKPPSPSQSNTSNNNKMISFEASNCKGEKVTTMPGLILKERVEDDQKNRVTIEHCTAF